MNIQEIHKQIVKYVNKGLIKGNEKVRKLWNDGEIDKENRKQNV